MSGCTSIAMRGRCAGNGAPSCRIRGGRPGSWPQTRRSTLARIAPAAAARANARLLMRISLLPDVIELSPRPLPVGLGITRGSFPLRALRVVDAVVALAFSLHRILQV